MWLQLPPISCSTSRAALCQVKVPVVCVCGACPSNASSYVHCLHSSPSPSPSHCILGCVLDVLVTQKKKGVWKQKTDWKQERRFRGLIVYNKSYTERIGSQNSLWEVVDSSTCDEEWLNRGSVSVDSIPSTSPRRSKRLVLCGENIVSFIFSQPLRVSPPSKFFSYQKLVTEPEELRYPFISGLARADQIAMIDAKRGHGQSSYQTETN